MAVKPPQNKAMFDDESDAPDAFIKPLTFEPIVKNKGGRPRGKSEAQILFDTYVKPQSAELIQNALHYAHGGETSLMLFFLRKLLPVGIANREPLKIDSDPTKQIDNILNWVIAGNADISEGVQLTSIVEKSVMLKRMDELTGKLAAIENWMKQQTNGVIEGEIEHDEETKGLE